MEPAGPLPYLQKPVVGPYPDSVVCNSILDTVPFQVLFLYYNPISTLVSEVIFSVEFCILFLIRAMWPAHIMFK